MTPLPRTAPNWKAVETPQPWNYQPVYPSRTACAAGEGLTFEVGPGKQYTSLKQVPWLTLIPCDQVNIYYSSTPYRDIVFLGSRGAANKWITIKGIPGPNGELPVLDGNGAVMPSGTGANTWLDSSGMMIIAKPDASVVPRVDLYKPGYLHITGLKFVNARPPSKVTKMSGTVSTWGNFSAGLYILGAEKVAVTYCEFDSNGLGLFANSHSDEINQTRNLLVAHNYFHGNSNPGSFSEHNAYTEGVGTVYEYNYFGPILSTSYGDNIKERSAGVVFRYNYIEGGSNLISLRDPESNVDFETIQTDAWGENLVKAAFVYSNTLVAKDLNIIIGHGDNSNGTNKQPREGNLYFYSNRVVSIADNQSYWESGNYYDQSPTVLFDLLNTRAPTTVVARNNLMYGVAKTAGAKAAPFALFYYQGIADFQSNWTTTFMNVRGGTGGTTLATGTKFNGTGLGGLAASTASPGFVDFVGGNYLTTTSSPYASLKAAYPDGITKRSLSPTTDPVSRPFQ